MKDDLTRELEQYYIDQRPDSTQYERKSFSGDIFVVIIAIAILLSIGVRLITIETTNDVSTETERASDKTIQIIDKKIVDPVEYENLDPGKTYLLTVTIIMDYDTGEVAPEQLLQFTPTHESGATELEFVDREAEAQTEVEE